MSISLNLAGFLILCSSVLYSENARVYFDGNKIEIKEAKNIFLDTIPSSNKKSVFGNCVENINLSNVETNLSYLYWASNSITADNSYRVNSGSDIKMKAGEVIVLKPNTVVLKGNRYLAKIEDCKKTCEGYEIPKGLSPNGDGINDVFDLSEVCDIINVKIFNRYGMQIFEKDNYINEWYGQDFNNSELPTATYFYVAKLANGNVKTGWVYLNR